jgi:hypothetical protein
MEAPYTQYDVPQSPLTRFGLLEEPFSNSNIEPGYLTTHIKENNFNLTK